jgi:hypothetical protein
MQRLPCHVVPEKSFTGFQNISRNAVGAPIMIGIRRIGSGAEKTHQPLVYSRFPYPFRTGQCADACCQAMRILTSAVDECSRSLLAKLPESGIGGDAAPTVGPFRSPIDPVTGNRIAG